jgi:hypothetical protein
MGSKAFPLLGLLLAAIVLLIIASEVAARDMAQTYSNQENGIPRVVPYVLLISTQFSFCVNVTMINGVIYCSMSLKKLRFLTNRIPEACMLLKHRFVKCYLKIEQHLMFVYFKQKTKQNKFVTVYLQFDH